MKKTLTEERDRILEIMTGGKFNHKKIISEGEYTIDHMQDYYSEYDNLFREILGLMISKSNEQIILRKIQPNMYQKALNEFIKFGQLTHYPTKFVTLWKDIVIENYTYLDVITNLYGHTSSFDIDIFNDTVLYDDGNEDRYLNDWSDAWEHMTEMGYDIVLDNILPHFSNGHELISDYGLNPLGVIIKDLLNTTDPNEILVLINKALDVSHQRSDLSELFIEGGESSLDRISGLNEDYKAF